MRREIVIASLKGGVGKSTLANVWLGAARAAGRVVSAWDLDGANGSLARRFPDNDPVVGCGKDDIRNPDSAFAWLDALYNPADDVILDVPGGAIGDLLRVVDGGPASLKAAAADAKREFVVVSVIGRGDDATETPQEAIEVFGRDGVHHVVVKNGFFGAEDAFDYFDGRDGAYGETARAVRDAGGEVVYLPRLGDSTYAQVIRSGLTFAEAASGMNAFTPPSWRNYWNTRFWVEEAVKRLSGTWLAVDGNVPATKGKREKATA